MLSAVGSDLDHITLIATTSSTRYWSGCFSPHLSTISMLTPSQTNRTKRVNAPVFHSIKLNKAGGKTQTEYSLFCPNTHKSYAYQLKERGKKQLCWGFIAWSISSGLSQWSMATQYFILYWPSSWEKQILGDRDTRTDLTYSSAHVCMCVRCLESQLTSTPPWKCISIYISIRFRQHGSATYSLLAILTLAH